MNFVYGPHFCISSEGDGRPLDVQIVYWQIDSLRVCNVYTLAEEEYDKHTVVDIFRCDCLKHDII